VIGGEGEKTEDKKERTGGRNKKTCPGKGMARRDGKRGRCRAKRAKGSQERGAREKKKAVKGSGKEKGAYVENKGTKR